MGLKGVEDLGGGYATIFKLEDGFNAASGALSNSSALFGREAWVGITGPFGGVQFGELYTILHTTLVTYSLPGLGALAWGNATNNFVGPAFLRVRNSMRYTSPRHAGFMLRAMAARGTNGAAGQPSTLGDTYGVGLNYVRGGLSVDVDTMQQSSARWRRRARRHGPAANGNYTLGAISYDFSVVKVAALYMRHRGGPDVATAIDSQSAYPHSDIMELSATVPIGRASLLLSVGHYRKVADSDGNADSYGIRFDYPLSKRTVLYTGAAMVRNGAHARFVVNGAAGGGSRSPSRARPRVRSSRAFLRRSERFGRSGTACLPACATTRRRAAGASHASNGASSPMLNSSSSSARSQRWPGSASKRRCQYALTAHSPAPAISYSAHGCRAANVIAIVSGRISA